MMLKNGLISNFFTVIFLTLFTASFSYAGDGEDNDKSTTIPANAHQDENSWTCDEGLFINIDATGCLPVPANASSSYNSNDFICDVGYYQKKNGNSCLKIPSDIDDGKIIDIFYPPPKKVTETFELNYALITLFVFILFIGLFKIERNPRLTIKRRSFKKNPRPKPPPRPTNTNVKEHSSDSEWHLTQQTETIKSLRTDLSALKKDINDMSQTFMTLKTSLDQKDEEISRYKNGYDATIFKNFLLRFTRVDKVIKEYMGDNKIDLNGLQDIQIQMDDALAECNVEIFSPEIGLDYKTTAGVADNPELRETSEMVKDETIAEILMPGYRRKLPTNDYQIIVEAKVVIHVYKKNK
jgi:molecular chaperone GrpE (heat shock protein)